MNNLKEYVVVQHIAGERPMLWTKKDLESHLNWSKEHNRTIKIKLLHDFSDELKDSPYQGSAGVWVKASERTPNHYRSVHVRYTRDGDQCKWTIRYNVSMGHWLNNGNDEFEVTPDLEWLDESAASPAGDGLPPDLEEMIKREPVTFFLINALRYLDYKQRLLLIESLRERTIVEAVLPSPPNKSV